MPNFNREVLGLLPALQSQERPGRLLLRPVRAGSGVRRVPLQTQHQVLHAPRRGLHITWEGRPGGGGWSFDPGNGGAAPITQVNTQYLGYYCYAHDAGATAATTQTGYGMDC